MDELLKHAEGVLSEARALSAEHAELCRKWRTLRQPNPAVSIEQEREEHRRKVTDKITKGLPNENPNRGAGLRDSVLLHRPTNGQEISEEVCQWSDG